MPKTQELMYAVVGAGDFAAEKVRKVRKVADRKLSQKYYKEFVKRGKTVTTKIKNSAPAKRALQQTKSAREQVTTATSGVGKAVRKSATARPARQTKKSTAAKAS